MARAQASAASSAPPLHSSSYHAGGVGPRPAHAVRGGGRGRRGCKGAGGRHGRVAEGRLGCQLESELESDTRVMEAPGQAEGEGTGRGCYSRAGRLLAELKGQQCRQIRDRQGAWEGQAGSKGQAGPRTVRPAQHMFAPLAGGTTIHSQPSTVVCRLLWAGWLGGGAGVCQAALIRSWRPEPPAQQSQRPRGQPGRPWRPAGRCPTWRSGRAA